MGKILPNFNEKRKKLWQILNFGEDSNNLRIPSIIINTSCGKLLSTMDTGQKRKSWPDKLSFSCRVT